MPQNSLILGNWNAICDSCGRKFKATELQKRWDGLMCCPEDWEQRHPQDFLRVQKEKIAVDWARPEAEPDHFIQYCTLEGSSSIAQYAIAGCAIAGTYLFWPGNNEWIPLGPSCTQYTVRPIADGGTADCAVVGWFYTPPHISINYVPPFCDIQTILTQADYATADCATLGIIP